MAARGSLAKEQITEKLLEAFPGAFKYEKEIRIPWTEDGEPLQIKITMTAAKNMVESGEDIVVPGVTKVEKVNEDTEIAPQSQESLAPTAEEKQNVADLLARLGL